MKTIFILCFLCLFSLPTFANDGSYITSGSQIYPVKETSISMDKEVLSFTVRDKVAQVDILFEFLNPTNQARTMMVGFQAPSSSGDVDVETSSVSQIRNFKVMQEGKLLPYQLKAARCADCELKETSAFRFDQSNNGVFVYLFEVTFQPGITRIHHSYEFPASSSVMMEQTYSYILTTGAKWANKQIRDFTLNIDMGENKYFFVDDVFGATAEWNIVGTGKVTGKKQFYESMARHRMVRVISGKLQVKVKDFSPQKNIGFGIVHSNCFFIDMHDKDPTARSIRWAMVYYTVEDAELTKAELRIARNAIYAQHGYAFKSKDLQDYFQQFDWYIPDPNIMLDEIQLSTEEQRFIREIREKEKG